MGYGAFYVICPRAPSQYVTPQNISPKSRLLNGFSIFVVLCNDDTIYEQIVTESPKSISHLFYSLWGTLRNAHSR